MRQAPAPFVVRPSFGIAAEHVIGIAQATLGPGQPFGGTRALSRRQSLAMRREAQFRRPPSKMEIAAQIIDLCHQGRVVGGGRDRLGLGEIGKCWLDIAELPVAGGKPNEREAAVK